MKRYLSLISVLACTFALTSLAAPKRPHVILIMTDDQGGWDYGFMGNKIVETSNLDAMAARGVRMTRF